MRSNHSAALATLAIGLCSCVGIAELKVLKRKTNTNINPIIEDTRPGPAGLMAVPQFQDLPRTLGAALGVDAISGEARVLPGYEERARQAELVIPTQGAIRRRTQLVWDSLPASSDVNTLNPDQFFAYFQIADAASQDFVTKNGFARRQISCVRCTRCSASNRKAEL